MSTIHEDLRRVIIHDREFQKSSIDEEIYCVPVDEVSCKTPMLKVADRHPHRLSSIIYRSCADPDEA